jgi:hypothetical protein
MEAITLQPGVGVTDASLVECRRGGGGGDRCPECPGRGRYSSPMQLELRENEGIMADVETETRPFVELD